jgi:PAS domain S-box-containing protein
MEKRVSTQRGGHLEALLNSCPDAIIAIDANGIIKFANKEASKLTERSMTELIGESIVEVYENREAAREMNRKLYESGGVVYDVETKTRTKSGKLIPVRVSASHLKDSAGNYTGAVGYFAQYRPWSGAEAQVKERLEELETLLERWRSLAAPVFELYPGLSVMVVVGHLGVNRSEDVTTNLLNHVGRAKTRVVLLDLSAAVIENDKVANQLTKAIRTVRLLGANCVIAGIQPSFAKAMEPLLGDLSYVKSYSCMELALEEALNIIGYQIVKKS